MYIERERRVAPIESLAVMLNQNFKHMSDYKDYGYNTDNFNHIHQYLLEPLMEIISERKYRKILDIGCGNGWLTNYLIENGFDAYGTDASQSGIEIAKKKIRRNFLFKT